MDLPANVLPILVIILCIFLAVALVGLTYCLNYWCVTRKKKNEVSPISRVEKRFETIPDSKLPKNNTVSQLVGTVPFTKSQLNAMFTMPHCCVFPINRAHIELNYLIHGTKFVVTNEPQKIRIRNQLLRNWDSLLFVQQLDLMSQTCVGGFIFTDVKGENKIAAIVVRPHELFNFLMNHQSLSSFLHFSTFLHFDY